MGGVLPLSLANGVRWLVGWTAFIIPIVFAIQIVQVFRQPDSRIPAVIWVSTVMFVALFAGTFQLVVSDPMSLEIAKTGNGGGVLGWAVADPLWKWGLTAVLRGSDLLTELVQRKRVEGMYQTFMRMLEQKAKIEVYNSRVLESAGI